MPSGPIVLKVSSGLFVQHYHSDLSRLQTFIKSTSLHLEERVAVACLTELADGIEQRPLAPTASMIRNVRWRPMITLHAIISPTRHRGEYETKAAQAEMPIETIPVRVWLDEAGKEPTRCSG